MHCVFSGSIKTCRKIYYKFIVGDYMKLEEKRWWYQFNNLYDNWNYKLLFNLKFNLANKTKTII